MSTDMKPSIARHKERLDKLYRNAGRHHVEAMRLLARTRGRARRAAANKALEPLQTGKTNRQAARRTKWN